MAAYAPALYQQVSGRDGTATPFFTTPDEPHGFQWSPSRVDTLETDVAEQVKAAIDSSAA